MKLTNKLVKNKFNHNFGSFQKELQSCMCYKQPETDQLFWCLVTTSILLPPYYLIENGQEKFLNKEPPSSHVNVGSHVLMFSYIVSRFCSLVSTDGLFGLGRKLRLSVVHLSLLSQKIKENVISQYMTF